MQHDAQSHLEHFNARILQCYTQKGSFLVQHGLTKACKSTTSLLISGKLLESYLTQYGDTKIRLKKVEGGYDPIGHQIESKTIVPNFFKDCLDLPGVGDSRALVIALINAYMKFICLKGNKQFRFAIFVHQSGLTQPGTDFITTMKTFFESFPKLKQSMPKILSATVLIISKATKTLQETRNKIKMFSKLKPNQIKRYQSEYQEFLTNLIEQDRILIFKRPESVGKIIMDQLSKPIMEKTKLITFQQGEIGSSIAVDIKESLSRPDMKQEFDAYIKNLESTIDNPIKQGLEILIQFTLNAFNHPEDLFTNYDQPVQGKPTFKEHVIQYVETYEKSLSLDKYQKAPLNQKVQDFVARHNVLRDKFLLKPIKEAKQANSFSALSNQNQKPEATVTASSNCAQFLTYQNLKIILHAADVRQLLQGQNLSIYQQTNKLKQILLSVMGRLSKLMLKEKENYMYFFRFCYALKNKIDWVMAGMLMLCDSADNEINSQFSKILLNKTIQDSFNSLNNRIHLALANKVDNFQLLSHDSKVSSDLLILYYALQLKPNEKSNSHYLNFISERLDELLAKSPQGQSYQAEWERNLIKKRKAQNLRILGKKFAEEGRLKSACYFAAESIYYCQKIDDDEAKKIAIKSRSLLARTIQTAIKESYKRKQTKNSALKSTAVKVLQVMIQSRSLEEAIEQNKITIEDCLEIFKANNQTNQELRLLQEQYNRTQEQKVGTKLINRLFDCQRRQKALEIGQKVYEAAADNLDRKKFINELISSNLEKMDDKLVRYKRQIQQRQDYKNLSAGFLRKFHFDMKKQTGDSSSTD